MTRSRRNVVQLLAFCAVSALGTTTLVAAVAGRPALAATAAAVPMPFNEFAADGANGRTWNSYDRTVDASGPTISGTPSGLFDHVDGLDHVFVMAADRDLVEYVDSGPGGSWNTLDLTAGAGAAPVGGSPDVLLDSSGLIHVYIEAANGDLMEYVDDDYGGRIWNAWDLSGGAGYGSPVSGSPSAVQDGAGMIHVYVPDKYGNLTEYVPDNYDGHIWNAWDLSGGAGYGSPVSGSPSAVIDSSGLLHVYVGAVGGRLTEYVPDNYGGHIWNAWDLSDGSGYGSPILNRPSAIFDRNDGQLHVYVTASDGHLSEYVDDNYGGHVWNAWDLSGGAGYGSPVIGSPSALIDSSGATHVYVASANRDLTEYVDDDYGGHIWNAWDITAGSSGPAIGTDPSVIDANGLLQVFAGGPLAPHAVQQLVDTATSQDQHAAAVVETPLGSNCNPYTASWGRGTTAGCALGTAAEEWCSDFAQWVWQRGGINTSGITGWAFTWVQWGERHTGAFKPGATNDPVPGDAVVWGNMASSYAMHVAIVVGVSQGQIDVVSGNGGPPIDAQGDVAAVWESGYFDPSTSTDSGYPIIGYVSPTGWTGYSAQVVSGHASTPASTAAAIATQDGGR